jgi:hypothetical protein
MYDWANACVGVGTRGNKQLLKPSQTVLTGNVAIAGPDTKLLAFVKAVDPGGRVTLRDNVAVDGQGTPLALTTPGVVVDAAPPSTPRWQTLERVLRTAGARPAHRDPIDTRIVQSVVRGDGHIINSQESVGGYPTRPSTARKLVVPEGFEARRKWLAALAAELEEDKTLAISPLLSRLRVH